MARPRPFDDRLSILHFLAATASALLGVEVAATMTYILYQLLERERLHRKLGDTIEWLAGLLAGAALRLLIQLHGLPSTPRPPSL